MTPIADICEFLVIPCPKCKTGQFVRSWGANKCKFEGCDNEWDVPYDSELLLKESVLIKKQLSIQLNSYGRIRYVWTPPRLQKLHDGSVIAVPQPDTALTEKEFSEHLAKRSVWKKPEKQLDNKKCI